MIECLWLEIKTQQTTDPALIGQFYRNSAYKDDWDECFMDLMFKVYSSYKHVVLLGDFNVKLNLPQPKWSSMISMLNLTQVITNSTRETEECASVIDHIYTNDTTYVSNIRVVDSSISDHKSIFCNWSYPGTCNANNKACHSTIEYRYMKNFEPMCLSHDLSLAPFDLVFKEQNGERAINLLTNILRSVIDKHAPLRKKRVKHPSLPPWLTNDIIEAMAERDSFKKAKRLVEYRSQRNKVNTMVRKAKAQYFNKLLEKNKSIKTVWSAINEILNTSKNKTSNPASHIHPEEFNRFFLSVSDRLLSQEKSESDGLHNSALKKYCQKNCH